MEKSSIDAPLLSKREERKTEVLVEVKKQLWLAGPMIAGSLLQNVVQMISIMFVGHLGELSLAGASMASSFAGVTGYSLLVKKQVKLAWPLISSYLMQCVIRLISLSFVGHLSELSLAGASLASSFANVTGFSLMMGSASAMDTLCGQAYGAKEYHLLGIHKQRAMIILTILSIPLAVIWFYTGEILLFFGQTPDISYEAGIYAKWMIPSLFAYGLLQCHVRFLQTQNIVFITMFSSGLTAVLHIGVCWIMVYKLGMGSKGAALANGVSYWLNVGILAVYVRVSENCRNTWVGFSMEAFGDLIGFVKLAIPSALMVCLEWWSFEFLVLLSGLLPNPELETSTLSVTLNTASFMFMIPFGLGAAISTRVSNELGAGKPQAAKLAVSVVLCLAITGGLIIGLILILIRNVWGYAFSNEEEVVKYVAIMLPILSVSNILDGIQSVLSGVVRGCGLQKIGACVNLGAFYIVGIPCAILLAFVAHVGGKGLWMGIICGIFVQVVLLLTITLCTNWEKEARKAKDRVFSSSLPTGMIVQ